MSHVFIKHVPLAYQGRVFYWTQKSLIFASLANLLILGIPWVCLSSVGVICGLPTMCSDYPYSSCYDVQQSFFPLLPIPRTYSQNSIAYHIETVLLSYKAGKYNTLFKFFVYADRTPPQSYTIFLITNFSRFCMWLRFLDVEKKVYFLALLFTNQHHDN